MAASHNITRRDFVKALSLGTLSMTVPKYLLAADKNNVTSPKMPNIIFILADDMGFGDLSCQNPESKISTPNMDAMANQGIRFTDAHSPSSVCTPTRYGILTGRYCWRTRLKREVLWPFSDPLIEKHRLTVAELLKQNGYDTACIGKWHLGIKWTTTDGKSLNPGNAYTGYAQMPENIDWYKRIIDGPLNHGFKYFFGMDAPNFPPYCYIENDRTLGIPSTPKPDFMFGCPGPMLEEWDLYKVLPDLTEKAVSYIDQKAKDDNPFFLYFSLTAPHSPVVPTPNFTNKSNASYYGDFVYQMDDTVGQIINALKRNEIDENTLVIFSSDNGSPANDGSNANGEPGSVRKYGHNPSGIFRGMKADIWEGGHRIPFIAKWPKKIKPGIICEEVVCLSDFMATVAAIIDAKLPDDVGEDSYNILPLLLGEKIRVRKAIVHHSYDGTFAIREGNWKLILGPGSGAGAFSGITIKPKEPPMQLYDLEKDISETTNLYSEYPDIVKRLANLLDDYHSFGRSAPKR